jgi:antirestriction protein ArdC
MTFRQALELGAHVREDEAVSMVVYAKPKPTYRLQSRAAPTAPLM